MSVFFAAAMGLTIVDYIGGIKPNCPKSEVISQNVQEWVILPFLSCDVVLPTTVAVLPVGGMVPPEGECSRPVCAPPPTVAGLPLALSACAFGKTYADKRTRSACISS